MEAVRTNVLGTENVVEAAIAAGVRRVVCLSTDKAVYPINAMGISKAMMEKVMVAASRNLEQTATVICGTRYGNVIASRGSVIPLFVEQVLAGKPITVTDPTMTRFMMTLDDAVELVLFAFAPPSIVRSAPAKKPDFLPEVMTAPLTASLVVKSSTHLANSSINAPFQTFMEASGRSMVKSAMPSASISTEKVL
jgi:UDP-glucose 4-epimerase